MANDPRLNAYFDETHYAGISAPSDSSINLPTLTAGGYVVSTSLGLAVTNVSTGTLAPQVGLGAAGAFLWGKIKQVEDDGWVSIQDRGYMKLGYVTGGNQPVPANPVGVDGTGKAYKTATYLGAICHGFLTDPTTGSTVCIVQRS